MQNSPIVLVKNRIGLCYHIRNLFPKSYLEKYKIDNLWKYDLPNAWRLIYSIKNGQITILSIILEWMNHKDYEKRFKY